MKFFLDTSPSGVNHRQTQFKSQACQYGGVMLICGRNIYDVQYVKIEEENMVPFRESVYSEFNMPPSQSNQKSFCLILS